MPASLIGRLLAILSVAGLGLAAGGAASASPATRATPRASMTSASYPGPSINGPVTWTDSISTQDSTETQSGNFTLDLGSTLEPPSYAPVFTTRDSTYHVTDNYFSQYQVNGCTITGTGTIQKSGTLTDNDLQPGVDWLNTDGPLSATELGFTISLHMTEPLHWTSPCGIQGPPDRPVTFAPACLNDPGDEGAFGGPFGGKRDTVNVGCHGSSGTSYQWKISGTPDVDAYAFVLPRSVYTAKQWKLLLLKPHHDHPSADIKVPVGTRFFAVTAGDIAVINQKVGTCGKGVVLQGFDGVTYTYCHASKIDVVTGQGATPGMLLGLTGNTGMPTTGPHLHFQIRYLGLLRCPQTFLWDLYLQKALTAHDVYNLPTTGCIS